MKKVFSIISIVLIAQIIFFVFINPSKVSAAWFDDNYANRQKFSFTHNADITSERAITFSLDTAELITAGVMQSDCDDTRFTDISGKVLRYQLTGSCNNAATTYEVVFPSIINGTNYAYVYYGNPSAVSESISVSSVTALTPSGGDPAITTRTVEEKGVVPMIYLKMDEAVDNTCLDGSADACDSTANKNNSNRSGAAWQSADLCITGTCLLFDGTDDVLTVQNASTVDFDLGLNSAFTFQAWIRVNSDGENSTGEIVDKGSHFYIRVDSEGADGLADLQAGLDLGTADATANITDGITLNHWHHVAVTYTDDADDDITIYIDGVSKGTGDGSGSPVGTDSSQLLIGGDSSNNFHGFIDEFKINNYEKTALQMKTEYYSMGTKHAVSTIVDKNQKYLSDDLSGYWKLDPVGTSTTPSGPTNIDDAGNPGILNSREGRQLVRTSTGTLYAAFYDSGSCEIWSSTDGTSWTEQDSADKPGCNSSPSLAIDSNNDLHLFYLNSLNNYFTYTKFTTSTSQFQALPETIQTNSVEGTTLSIAIDSNNIPHLYFSDFDDGLVTANNYYVNKVGGTWNTIITLETTNTSSSYWGTITINEDNIPEIAYINYPDVDITAAVGDANNATSFTLQDVDTSAKQGIYWPSIGIDSSGNTWIAYEDENGSDDYITLVKHNDADSWATWQTPINNTTVGTYPSIAIDGTTVYVYFETSYGIAYDKYNGTTWQGETPLQAGSYNTPKARWSSLNNPSYSTHGYDYLYDDGTDVYWAALDTNPPTHLLDNSGNSNSLTNNGTLTFTNGKYATGSEHVPASSQYLSSASSINNVKSVSFWVNPDSTTNYYMSLTSSAYITSSTGTLSATGFSNAKIYVNGVETSTISADSWQLVTVTTDTEIDASQFYIGRQGSNYFDGTMDEIRLYNRTLKLPDIQAIYNWQPTPIAHWKFDDPASSIAFDSSSRGNNLTERNGVSSAPGKYGSAVDLENKPSGTQILRILDGSQNEMDITGPMAIEAWINMESSDSTIQGVAGTDGNSPSRGIYLGVSAADKPVLTISGDGTNTTTITGDTTLTTNTWYHLSGVYDGSNLHIYLNGIRDRVSGAQSYTSGIFATTASFCVGGRGASCRDNRFDGKIDDVRVYNYARTPGQVIEDYNAGHPVPGSPIGSYVAYWKFDDGATASFQGQDSSPYNNDLGGSSEGILSSSGKFDGAYTGASGRYMSKTDDDDFDFAANESFSISTWLRRSTISNDECILVKGVNPIGYLLTMDSDGDIVFGIGDQSSVSLPEETIGSTLGKNYDDDTWHHAVATKNGTTSIDLYVDGKKIASDTSLAVTGTLENNGTMRFADCDGTDNTNEFLGYIDEMQVYRTALSESQIKVLYNRASAMSLGALGTSSTGTADNSRARSFCVPGDSSSCAIPVAYYPLDNMSSTGRSEELSGSFTSELTTTLGVRLTNGKYSQAFDFDGSAAAGNDGGMATGGDDTLLDMNATDDYTFSAWFNSDSVTADKTILKKGPRVGTDSDIGYILYIRDNGASDILQFRISDGAEWCTINGTTVISSSTWYHVAVVIDRDSAANSNIYLNGIADKASITCKPTYTFTDVGNISNGVAFRISPNNGVEEFDGKIDDVRVYNYIRTSAQRMWDMNRGAPIGHWKLDECQGTTAYDTSLKADRSNSRYDGTITPGASGNTSAGTCSSGTSTEMWNDGTNGKLNSSLGFDGTDDYVSYGDLNRFDFGDSQDFTIAVWVKTNINSLTDVYPRVISKDGGSPRFGFNLLANTAQFSDYWRGEIYVSDTLYQCSGQHDITDNTWHHLVMQRNGSNLLVYLDGNLVNTCAASSSSIANAQNLNFGSASTPGDYFTGQIDDVRIYNYALTAHQVRVVRNDGSVKFGPQEGNP